MQRASYSRISSGLRILGLGVCLAVSVMPISAGLAQTPAPPATAPSAGSPDTFINGKPAQRAGDQIVDTTGTAAAASAPAPGTSPNVMINGKPAVIGGCADGVPITSPNVFIDGKPAVIGCAKK